MSDAAANAASIVRYPKVRNARDARQRALAPLIACTADVLGNATQRIKSSKLLQGVELAPKFAPKVAALVQEALPYCSCTLGLQTGAAAAPPLETSKRCGSMPAL